MMNFINRNAGVIALIAIVVSLFAIFAIRSTPVVKTVVGAVSGETNLNVLGVSGLKVGPTCNDSFGSGSCDTQSALLGGTANLIGADVTVTASSSAAFDIAVTGAKSGDACIVQLSKSQTSFLGWAIISSHASTTDGYCTVNLANFSGTDAKPSVTAVGSSTQYWITR